MPSTWLFFFSCLPFCNLAYSQLAEKYGADVANTILKRYRDRSSSKPLRGNTHTSGTPRGRYSRRKEVPLYPFKSKYGQQSNPFLGTRM